MANTKHLSLRPNLKTNTTTANTANPTSYSPPMTLHRIISSRPSPTTPLHSTTIARFPQSFLASSTTSTTTTEKKKQKGDTIS